MPDRLTQSSPTGTERPGGAAAWIVAGAATLAFAGGLFGALVLDDAASVRDNPSIRALWPPSAWWFQPAGAGVAGRPLASFSLALNYAVSGSAVWSYHALNVGIHVCAALGLLGVVRRTLRRPRLAGSGGAQPADSAMAIALLWAVHPLATATVDYVSQRTELLMAVSFLAVIYCFLHALESDRPRGWLAGSVFACALGMAAKESMVTAPVMVLLFDRTWVSGSFRAAWRARRGYYLALGATWLFLATLMLTSDVAERGVGFSRGISSLTYALTECRAVMTYLGLAVWPNPLVFDYGWDYSSAAAALPFVVLVVALATATAVGLWKKTALGFLGAWFLVILAPTSSLVPLVHQPIAESRAYLPLAAVIAAVVLTLRRLLGRRAFGPFVGAALAVAVVTQARHRDYRSALALWTDTVAKRPANARAHGELAAAYLAAGQPAAAAAAAAAAVRLRPAYPEALTNLGSALAELGRHDEAVVRFRAALQLAPDSPEAHANLGRALLRQGARDDAIIHFRAALRAAPALAKVHNDLSVALLDSDQTDEALRHASEAVRLEPGLAEAHYNLGNALARAGANAEAIAAFETALRRDPAFARAEHNLGAILFRAGRVSEAIAHFEAALRLKPDYPEAQRNLALARQAAAR